jgi:hypothetical protein
MRYIAQYKPHGCRNWRDISSHPKSANALRAFANLNPKLKRVRVLAIPPAQKTIAEAFYSEPTVIFEGEFK